VGAVQRPREEPPDDIRGFPLTGPRLLTPPDRLTRSAGRPRRHTVDISGSTGNLTLPNRRKYRRDHATRLVTTLLCYDGSDSAKHAIAAASETLSANRVVLLHIMEPAGRSSCGLIQRPRDPSRQVTRRARGRRRLLARRRSHKRVWNSLARSAGTLNPPGTCDGDVWRVILDVASSTRRRFDRARYPRPDGGAGRLAWHQRVQRRAAPLAASGTPRACAG